MSEVSSESPASAPAFNPQANSRFVAYVRDRWRLFQSWNRVRAADSTRYRMLYVYGRELCEHGSGDPELVDRVKGLSRRIEQNPEGLNRNQIFTLIRERYLATSQLAEKFLNDGGVVAPSPSRVAAISADAESRSALADFQERRWQLLPLNARDRQLLFGGFAVISVLIFLMVAPRKPSPLFRSGDSRTAAAPTFKNDPPVRAAAESRASDVPTTRPQTAFTRPPKNRDDLNASALPPSSSDSPDPWAWVIAEAARQKAGTGTPSQASPQPQAKESALERFGWLRDRCMLCGQHRSANEQRIYSDRNGFGFCEECGMHADAFHLNFTESQRGRGVSPEIQRKSQVYVETVTNRFPFYWVAFLAWRQEQQWETLWHSYQRLTAGPSR